MRMRTVVGPLLLLALIATGCADAGQSGSDTTSAPVDGGAVVVNVDATYALGPGEEQTAEQLDRSCDAATTLFTEYGDIFRSPELLAPEELRRQVLGLGQLAMEVHEFAAFDQQDEVTVLTSLAIQLDERLSEFDYDWLAMQAEDGPFIEMLRREGMDTALISLLAWITAKCPEGTVPL